MTEEVATAVQDGAASGSGLLDRRLSGVLLHLTSLPGPHGNGDLGPEARRFVEFLARAGQSLWQMLPVNPVGYANSPYIGVSALAGSPLMIALDDLVADGLSSADELGAPLPSERVDYDAATAHRTQALRRAFARWRNVDRGSELASFRERHGSWLADYALFMAAKIRHGGAPWWEWDPALASRDAATLDRARADLAEDVAYFEFEQLVFDRQWRRLRSHAAEHGVHLIGDAPIFVAHDSADVWAHQSYFDLDSAGQPVHVSGVPPDYFSATGQRWGTPLYRWPELARHRFDWWIDRLRTLFERFDVVRLDHFIGFVRYWEIPAAEETAVNGRWQPGPDAAFFDIAREALGDLPLIAEDLGLVTASVHRLRERFGFPGMRILQFAFDGGPENPFLPHHYPRRCVAYTGTHDNDTVRGWFETTSGRDPEQARREHAAALRYLLGPHAAAPRPDLHWDMIRALFASAANTAIVPMQDVLGLGNDARMNLPGTVGGNWEWRVREADLSEDVASRLRAFTETYGRIPSATDR